MDQWFLERLEHQEHQGWEINVAAWCYMYVIHVLDGINMVWINNFSDNLVQDITTEARYSNFKL